MPSACAEYHDAGRDVPEEVARHGLLSDTLLQVYCALSAAPESILAATDEEPTPRTRYSMMGALLVAQDAAEAEVKRAEAERRA